MIAVCTECGAETIWAEGMNESVKCVVCWDKEAQAKDSAPRNPEWKKQYMSQYSREHREQRKEYQKWYRINHKEERQETVRKYNDKHKKLHINQ